ncbi:MAG: NUDIX domain-containing protein [Chloroflexi bacterium]|nr:NUDIX domain-containing protein [Chloroflexota bacterium]
MPKSDQGVFRDRYSLIPRVLIFLTLGEKVLLLKGSPTKRLWANLYNGIGGHIERGEDVISAAHREILEETGLKTYNLWLCALITIDTGQDVGIGMYVFRGDHPNGKIQPSDEGVAEWIKFSELKKLPLVEDLPTILPKILDMQPGDEILSVHYAYNKGGKLQIRFGK